jgi:hypothetical protein
MRVSDGEFGPGAGEVVRVAPLARAAKGVYLERIEGFFGPATGGSAPRPNGQ